MFFKSNKTKKTIFSVVSVIVVTIVAFLFFYGYSLLEVYEFSKYGMTLTTMPLTMVLPQLAVAWLFGKYSGKLVTKVEEKIFKED